MADEFDGCECVWSHEYAMQRLLNFIRQNQDACTDTECIDVSGRLQRPTSIQGSDEANNFTMITMMILFAVLMYMVRPASIRQFTKSVRSLQGQDPNNDNSGPQPPPPAPPAIN